jgi:CubicO group peptidase (beta-lactamase class C family)
MKSLIQLRVVLFLLCLPYLGNAQELDKAQIKKFEGLTQKAYQQFNPAGVAVLVLKDDKVIYKNALGYKNLNTKEVLTTKSLFNIASCSKAFTAAAIGILVQEGKLKWTDKVIDYIPEFRLSDPYITKEMTITDILCHRSGFATFDGDLLWYQTSYSDLDIIRKLKYLPVKQDFRSSFGYQNNMYLVAGEIIHRVSGKSWSEFIQEHFLTPLNMTDSRPSIDEVKPGQDLAQPHSNGKLQPIVAFKACKPAGAIFSSVVDLANWATMLLDSGRWNNNEILKSSTIQNLFADKTIIGARASLQKRGTHFYNYGLGWFVFDYQGNKIVEHDGGMPGYISKVTLVPEKKLAVIILNNGEDYYINDVIRYSILDVLLGGKDKDWVAEYESYKKLNDQAQEKGANERLTKRALNTSPSLPLPSYCGLYNDPSYGEAEVEMTGDSLKLTFLPAKETFHSIMIHWHYNTFKVKFKDAFLAYGLVTFSFNANGEVTGFKIDLPSNDFHFDELDFKKSTLSRN